MSEKPAFTPGPWAVVEQTETSLAIHTADGAWRICFMATPGDSPKAFHRIVADAELIAAAPDMFEALTVARKALVVQMMMLGQDVEESPFIADIDAALSKALGKDVP